MPREEVIHYLQQFVRTIFRRSPDGKVEFFGSCFVIVEQNRYFIATATHVMDGFSDHTPLFFDKGAESKLCPIQGNEYSLPLIFAGNAGEKYFDAALIELGGKSKENITENCSLKLSALDIDAKYSKSDGCLVVGYPAKMNRKNVDNINFSISPELYTLKTLEVDQEKYDQLGLNKTDYIVLHWDKKRAYSPEAMKRTAPDLNGLSGTPIWGVYEGKPKIVGMLTEHRARDLKVIVGVRARVIGNSIKALTIGST